MQFQDVMIGGPTRYAYIYGCLMSHSKVLLSVSNCQVSVRPTAILVLVNLGNDNFLLILFTSLAQMTGD